MASAPLFASVPYVGMAQIGTANTNRDGTTGTYATVSPGVPCRIDRIRIAATGSTTAGMIRIFLSDGTNVRLWREIPVVAITPSGTAPVYSISIPVEDLAIPSTWSIKLSTHNAETFNVFLHGGDLS